MRLFHFLRKIYNISAADEQKTVVVKVSGTKYKYASQMLSLGSINPDYSLDREALIKKYPFGTRVYEYIFPRCSASLEFEPTNENNPNAIKVIINGLHVGYIKRGSCSRIRNLVNEGKISSITASIRGGKCKELFRVSGTLEYEFKKSSSELYIELAILLK